MVLYVKSSLQSTGFSPKTEFPEHVWCRIPNHGGQDLLVGVCHRTPTFDVFAVDLDELLRRLIQEVGHRHLLMMGDFNYGDIDWSSPGAEPATEASKLFLDCLDDCFLTQHVTEPTRITGKSVLDLVITDQSDMVEKVEVAGNFMNSDHYMLYWETVVSLREQEHRSATKDFNKADFDGIRQALQQVNWDDRLTGDAEQCWGVFKEILHEAVKRFVPDRNVKYGTYRKAIWMTSKAVKCVRQKHNLFRRYRNINNPEYAEAARMARAEVRRSKKNFEKKLAENIKQDNKSFYAYARSRTKIKVGVGPLVTDAGEIIPGPGEMANELNEYFASVFTAENLQNIPQHDDLVRTNDGKPVLDDIYITEEMVLRKLRGLRSDKATGADDLSPRLLSQIQVEVCHSMTVIFQKSLQSGVVPQDWKLANVTPIYKKGGRGQSCNYRPVSLTSQVCKLFESIIRDLMVDHLERSELIRDSQHGFRRGRSCLSNLLVFLDKVTRAVDEGNCVDVVFLDFAKAFDKVPHQRLLVKLRRHGIEGRLQNWIAEWLNGRRQRVRIRGSYSDWRGVLSGVPQGSVLGPVLFLVFINDLDEGLRSNILKFADDTKIFGTATNDGDRQIIQNDLMTLASWANTWQMEFNETKCKVMHIGRETKRWSYQMNQHILESSTEEKDLGVVISDNLKSVANCRAAYAKANRVLGMIRRTITYKSKQILLPLYKTLVRPLVEYCTPAWSPHYSKDKMMIERIQHRFTRMIPGFAKMDYDARLQRLNLWTLEERRNRTDLIELFKIYRGLSGIKIDSMFEPKRNCRTRGHSLKLGKNQSNLEIRKFFFSERVVSRWNALSEVVVSVPTVNAFKNGLSSTHLSKKGFFTDT